MIGEIGNLLLGQKILKLLAGLAGETVIGSALGLHQSTDDIDDGRGSDILGKDDAVEPGNRQLLFFRRKERQHSRKNDAPRSQRHDIGEMNDLVMGEHYLILAVEDDHTNCPRRGYRFALSPTFRQEEERFLFRIG